MKERKKAGKEVQNKIKVKSLIHPSIKFNFLYFFSEMINYKFLSTLKFIKSL